MSNITYRLFTDTLGGRDPSTFVGNKGEITFDPVNRTFRFHTGDGTAGGYALSSGGGGSADLSGYYTKPEIDSLFPVDYNDLTNKPAIPTLGNFNMSGNGITTSDGSQPIQLSIFGPDGGTPNPALIAKTWQFNTDGSITFPDGSTMSTAAADGQTLSFNTTSNVLAISGGNSVDLSSLAGGGSTITTVDPNMITGGTGSSNGDLLVWNGVNWVPTPQATVLSSMTLFDLADTDFSPTVLSGQFLVHDGADWTARYARIGDMLDVTTVMSPADGEVLSWNGTTNVWEARSVVSVSPLPTGSDGKILLHDSADWQTADISELISSNGNNILNAGSDGKLYVLRPIVTTNTTIDWTTQPASYQMLVDFNDDSIYLNAGSPTYTKLNLVKQLNDLSNVNTAPVSGDVLTWDGSQWVASTPAAGGANELTDLTDVIVPSPLSSGQGYVLTINSSGFFEFMAAAGVDRLDLLNDTSIASPSTREFLVHDGDNWVNTRVGINSGDLQDVDANMTLANGDILSWDTSINRWTNIPLPVSGGGSASAFYIPGSANVITHDVQSAEYDYTGGGSNPAQTISTRTDGSSLVNGDMLQMVFFDGADRENTENMQEYYWSNGSWTSYVNSTMYNMLSSQYIPGYFTSSSESTNFRLTTAVPGAIYYASDLQNYRMKTNLSTWTNLGSGGGGIAYDAATAANTTNIVYSSTVLNNDGGTMELVRNPHYSFSDNSQSKTTITYGDTSIVTSPTTFTEHRFNGRINFESMSQSSTGTSSLYAVNLTNNLSVGGTASFANGVTVTSGGLYLGDFDAYDVQMHGVVTRVNQSSTDIDFMKSPEYIFRGIIGATSTFNFVNLLGLGSSNSAKSFDIVYYSNQATTVTFQTTPFSSGGTPRWKDGVAPPTTVVGKYYWVRLTFMGNTGSSWLILGEYLGEY